MEENDIIVDNNLINDDGEHIVDIEDRQNIQRDFNINIKKGSIYNNMLFVYLYQIIQSFISIGYLYLFYSFKIGDKTNKIYEIILFSLLGILIISYYTYYCLMDYFKKCNSYVQFIIITIFKICFFTFVYLMTVLTGDNRINFAHFLSRVYWRFSICLLYLLFMLYYYFTKENGKFFIYIIIGIISGLTYFFLTFFTQKKSDNWDRLWIYIIYLYMEICRTLVVTFRLSLKQFEKKYERLLEWKLNEFDLVKILCPDVLLLFLEAIRGCCQYFRFCKKIKKNFS